MFPRVKYVRHIRDYRLELRFTDHTQGELDLKDRILGRGGVFAPLQDVDFFKQVRVDPEAGTIIWPNDLDLDPDMLYSWVTGKPIRMESHDHADKFTEENTKTRGLKMNRLPRVAKRKLHMRKREATRLKVR